MALEHDSDTAVAKAVRAAGSQSAFGRWLLRKNGKPVGQSTVREWLKSGALPPEHVLMVEQRTGISRHDLRPDIYGPAPALLDSPAGFERAQ